MLDFRINTFLAVCKHMSYTRAAEELCITQPAVSQHIRYLEDYYKVRLFIHEGKRFYLSPAGELLQRTAIALRNDEHTMQEQMHRSAFSTMPFHFGVTMTIGEFVTSKPLSVYQKAHPETEMHVYFENTGKLVERLRAGDIGFALVEGYFQADEFATITFSTEEFIPVCAPHHEFLCNPQTLNDLLPERLIVREPGSGTRNVLEKNLDTHGIHLSDFAQFSEIGNLRTIIELVKADCGITFLYKIAVQKELKSGELVELQLRDFHMQHNFTFIWNKGSVYSKQYEAVCHELLTAHQTLQ